jgi:hypothetical protein
LGKVERHFPVKVCWPRSFPLQFRVTISHQFIKAPLAQADGAFISGIA